MYRAYLDNNIFFSSGSLDPAVKLAEAELDLTAGAAGAFTFTVEPDNVAYGLFEKLTSIVDVYRDNELIFSGRVIDQQKGLELDDTIQCEGLLAILNDSIFRPRSYNGTLQGLVEAIINSHNDQVDTDKQLQIGNIEITDEYLDREYQNYESSMSRMLDLVESYGGYMTVTKAGNSLFFNWLEDIAGLNNQGIDFGRNLLDIHQQSSAADIITVLIPLGAEMEQEDGTSKRLTIESVNNDDDYLINQAGIDEFGIVVGVQIWDDITTPSILKSRGQAYLNSQAVSKVSINVRAVDLAGIEMVEVISNAVAGIAVAGVTVVGTTGQMVPADIERFAIGQTIPVKSTAHGINTSFVCLEQHLNLCDPTQHQMTLGKTEKGYIGIADNRTKDNTRKIENIAADYVKNDTVNEINEQLVEQSSLIQQNANSISSAVQTINNTLAGMQSQLTLVQQTANSWSVFVNENGETLTYLRVDAQGLWIGRAQDPIKLLETNTAIKFVDGDSNVLLEINTEGIITPSVSAQEQVAFLSGYTYEWAIRKGAVINGKHNLNDLWIGG